MKLSLIGKAAGVSTILLGLWATSENAWTQSSRVDSSKPESQASKEEQTQRVAWPDPSLPRISMVFHHPEVAPNHFEIVVDSAGNGSYLSHSDVKSEATSGLENGDLERAITLTPATRDRIFELSKTARYFDGDFDYTKSRIAFSGKRTLSYIDKERAHSATFTWSENQAIEELDGIFLGISSTMETGWKLEKQLQHEKLALNGELSRLEQSTKNAKMRELQLIAAVLQQIASDESVMVVARRRAERLLKQAR